VDLPYHDARIPRAEAGALTNLGYPVVFWDRLAVRSLAMRTDRPPFSDVRVRRALSLAVDRKTWVAEHLDGEGAEAHGPVPSSMAVAGRPAAARGPLSEMIPPRPPCCWPRPLSRLKDRYELPGYGPNTEDSSPRRHRRVGVELQIVNEEYGPYIRGSFLGQFDEASWGPSSIFAEVDGYLYSFFRSGQAGNRSHVADTQLDAMLEAQRRVTSTSVRKKIIDDIQRRAAAQVYYVFTPYPRTVSSWAPRLEPWAEELLRLAPARGGLAPPG
jgi:ABC-type transport system substrate-binding protein